MPELRMNDAQLAAACADLGQQIAWPQVDVRGRVLARIEATPRRTAWWDALRSPRYGFAPAILTIALALLAVLVFSPDARATATDFLRLRGVQIFQGPVPTPSPTPSRSPGSIQTPTPSLSLGEEVTLAEARQRAGFPLVIPTDPLLGTADAVYVRAMDGATAVSFAYRVRTGIPVSPQAGLSALVTEFGGHLEPAILGKVAPQIELVTVNGSPGAWLSGQPHQVFYTSNSGTSFLTDTLRLAGNTLVWEQNGLVMRLEAEVDKATALRIAATFR